MLSARRWGTARLPARIADTAPLGRARMPRPDTICSATSIVPSSTFSKPQRRRSKVSCAAGRHQYRGERTRRHGESDPVEQLGGPERLGDVVDLDRDHGRNLPQGVGMGKSRGWSLHPSARPYNPSVQAEARRILTDWQEMFFGDKMQLRSIIKAASFTPRFCDFWEKPT